MSDFNPKSNDAMFATILQRIEDVTASQHRIESRMLADSSRIDTLEREKWFQRGVVAAIGIGVTAVWNWVIRKS